MGFIFIIKAVSYFRLLSTTHLAILRDIGHPKFFGQIEYLNVTDALRHVDSVEVFIENHVPDDDTECVVEPHSSNRNIDELEREESQVCL